MFTSRGLGTLIYSYNSIYLASKKEMRCFNIYCYRIAFMTNFKSQDVILYDTPPFMENEKEYAYAYKYKDYFWQKKPKTW